MIATPSNQADATRLITPTMLVLWLVLATVPLWIARVGLYPYLGIEILIWSLYALAFNLVLGTAGLPSFGHGAYFGVGATPVRAKKAEAALANGHVDDAVKALASDLDPSADVQADGATKRHLAGVLLRRVANQLMEPRA